jgi:hypothetical protein
VEYDISSSSDEYLAVMSLDRVEQSAVPLVAVAWPPPRDLPPDHRADLPTILVANDQVQSTAHQTILSGLCAALIARAFALISNCKCLAWMLLIITEACTVLRLCGLQRTCVQDRALKAKLAVDTCIKIIIIPHINSVDSHTLDYLVQSKHL